MFEAARAAAREMGFEVILLDERLEGEARLVAVEHAGLALDALKQGKRAIILSGGELTVTIRGHGRGGPNQEYALALALALNGTAGIAALSADTDGIDGGGGSVEDPAGAFIDATTLSRTKVFDVDPAAILRDNNSTGFFERLGDLLNTGPTYTNGNDFRAILIDPT